ncbi:hypothetical protein HDU67_005086, partial [Dinochytrium kinnereticum]
MASEVKQLHDLGTWELVKLPPGRRVIRGRWVLVKKKDVSGKKVKATTIRVFLAIINQKRMKMKGLYMKGAYLNTALQEEIFMKQLLEF